MSVRLRLSPGATVALAGAAARRLRLAAVLARDLARAAPRPRRRRRRFRRASRRRIWSAAGGLPPITRTRTAPAPKPRRAASAASPTISARGPRGGVIMHLPDQSQPTELQPQRRPGRQELHRPRRGAGRRPARPRDRLVRRPRAGHALHRSGSLRPLRHQRLCALRRRDRAGRQGRAEGSQEELTLTGRCSFRGAMESTAAAACASLALR